MLTRTEMNKKSNNTIERENDFFIYLNNRRQFVIDCYFAHACGYCQGVRESLNRKMALTCRYCGGGFLFIVSLLCSIM